MQADEKSYVPAAGHDWALPLYDPLSRLLRFDAMRAPMLARAELRPGHAVLDIGCGTGTLAIEIGRKHSGVSLTGVDPDPRALSIARTKSAQAGLAIRLDQGRSDALPYCAGSFDHVFSSFMFHHLEPHEKRATLREVRRVLKPGGSFHMLDFRDDHDHKSLIMRMLHAAHVGDKLRGQKESGVEEMMREEGLTDIRLESRRVLFFGSIGYYEAAVAT